jgi:hypothetical protein
MSHKRFYRSGELAALFGISSDALRYYERKQLLPSPTRFGPMDTVSILNKPFSVTKLIKESPFSV